MYKLSYNLIDIEAEKYLVANSETRTRKSHVFEYRIPRISEDVSKYYYLGGAQVIKQEFFVSLKWQRGVYCACATCWLSPSINYS